MSFFLCLLHVHAPIFLDSVFCVSFQTGEPVFSFYHIVWPKLPHEHAFLTFYVTVEDVGVVPSPDFIPWWKAMPHILSPYACSQ